VSQVATKKRLVISNESVQLIAHFHEQGSVLRGDAEGFCDSFEVKISINSTENPADIATLIKLARKMCFTEKALTGITPVRVSQMLNDQPLDIV
jgi:organic hydroperoxide reductase OsmC/OhrA